MSWTKEQLEAQLHVLIDIHEDLSAPWHDRRDMLAKLTHRKNQIRRQIKAAEKKERS